MLWLLYREWIHNVKSKVNGLYSTMCTVVQRRIPGFFAAFSTIQYVNSLGKVDAYRLALTEEGDVAWLA